LRQFGLIGFSLQHSFSKQFFSDKFKEEKLGDCVYDNFELKTIDDFPKLLKDHPNLSGLNITIPYKQSLIKFINSLDNEANDIGAVNVIRFEKCADGKTILTGYNTDHYGFSKSLKEVLPNEPIAALILGVGGGSKAVAYALKKMNIDFNIVSRRPQKEELSFESLTEESVSNHRLIVNTTPLGMFPHIETYPPIPYQYITNKHILFDLAYNPAETIFLKKGKEKGATIINGLKMLQYQAEKSWEIWNKH